MEMFSILAQAESNTPAETVIRADDINTQNQQTIVQTAEPNTVQLPAKRPPQAQWTQFIFIGLIFVVLWFVMFRGPKKRQQQQDQMVRSLKKNDRVQTIGGVLGTVLDVTDSEVTLKIDESNNTKIKVIPSAIHRVIEQK